MTLSFKRKNIGIKDLGKCFNCKKETHYYDILNNRYVCSEECYNILSDDYTNKLNNIMDNISHAINKRIECRQAFTKEFRYTIKEGLKFLVECMLLIPREVLDCIKNKNKK
ncbi:hypothetical protein H8697_02110 [[Eubacterium] tenue]|nr:hypothetical protein [[Eubacterium] tenue]MBC8630505.1 hypothetical protein [[Eubacterium] tenue]